MTSDRARANPPGRFALLASFEVGTCFGAPTDAPKPTTEAGKCEQAGGVDVRWLAIDGYRIG